jgi:hypothetical protein
MSIQTNLVIADGAATPVSHTYIARGADMRMAKWLETAGGVPIGMPVLTLANNDTTDRKDGSVSIELRLTIPILEVISGSDGGYTPQPKVAFKLFGKVQLVAPNRASMQNRKDLLALVKSALATTTVSETFVDLNPPN